MLIDLAHNFIRWKLRRLGVESKFIESDSCLIHYYHFPHPNPQGTVVLLHGLGTSSSTWIKIFPFLIREHQVFAIDLPGFGFSTVAEDKYYFTLMQQAAVVENFIRRSPLRSFTLVGQSFGGWIAARYAAEHPEIVEHLVLINTAGIYYRGVEELRKFFTIGSLEDLQRLFNLMWYRYPWYFKPFGRAILRDMNKRNVNEIVASIEAEDFLIEELTQLTMPVSLIWGKDDRLLSEQSVQIMHKIVPRLQVHFLSRCGHVPQLERPQDLIRVLQQVLQRGKHELD